MKEVDEMKGKLKFFGDEVEVLFPKTFDEFKFRLGEILGLIEDILPKLNWLILGIQIIRWKLIIQKIMIVLINIWARKK